MMQCVINLGKFARMRPSLLALLLALCANPAVGNDSEKDVCKPTLLGGAVSDLSAETRRKIADIWKRAGVESDARIKREEEARIQAIDLAERQRIREFFLQLPPWVQADVLIQPGKDVRVPLTPGVWAALGDGIKSKILDEANFLDQDGFVRVEMDATNRIEDAPRKKTVRFGPVVALVPNLTPISRLPRGLRDFARGMRDEMVAELTLSPDDSDAGEELRPTFAMRIYAFPTGELLGGEVMSEVGLRLDGESNGQWQTYAYFDANRKLLNPDATYSYDH